MSTEANKEQLTHWRKNLDSNFISGEDLKNSLNGLKPEMIVCIEKFQDAETFDQNKSAKKVITGLWMKEVTTGKGLYKPAILNKTNARFFIKETGSDFVDHWVGLPVIIYAQQDNRHGHVVRFKKYSRPVMLEGDKNFVNCRTAYLADNSKLTAIKTKYELSAEVEAALTKKEEAKR